VFFLHGLALDLKMTVGNLKATLTYSEALDWITFYNQRDKEKPEEGGGGKDFTTPQGIAQILGKG